MIKVGDKVSPFSDMGLIGKVVRIDVVDIKNALTGAGALAKERVAVVKLDGAENKYFQLRCTLLMRLE
jgi:hypothetical protein